MHQIVDTYILLSIEKDFYLDKNLFLQWKSQHLLKLMTQIRMYKIKHRRCVCVQKVMENNIKCDRTLESAY